MPKKPCSISFKPVGQNKPCTTVINGDLKVKKNTVAQCDITVKKCLNVKNIVYDTETIDETGQTISGEKSISWINTNGTGVLNDGVKDGLYKKVIKIIDSEEIIIAGSGSWTSVNSNGDNVIDGSVKAICCNTNGDIYIGGNFTEVDGNTDLKYFAKWDNTNEIWTSIKTGGDGVSGISHQFWSNASISCNDTNGDIYIGGNFTEVDGNTDLKYLAKWDNTNSSWTSVNGLNDGIIMQGTGNVNSIYYNNTNGDIYIGGEFTEVAGNPVLAYLAKWDNANSSWTSVNGSNDGLNSGILDVKYNNTNGDIYIGGQFSSNLAKWDNTNEIWTSIKTGGDGISDIVHTITINKNNNDIYIGGQFTEVDGNTDLNYLAKWDNANSSWTSVNGSNDSIIGVFLSSICFDYNTSDLYIGGLITSSTSSLNNLVKWDNANSSWTSVDSDGDNVNNSVNTICCDVNGNLYIGGDFTEVDGDTDLKYLANYKSNIQILPYTLTYNSGETTVLTDKGDSACFIYNEILGEWVKV